MGFIAYKGKHTFLRKMYSGFYCVTRKAKQATQFETEQEAWNAVHFFKRVDANPTDGSWKVILND